MAFMDDNKKQQLEAKQELIKLMEEMITRSNAPNDIKSKTKKSLQYMDTGELKRFFKILLADDINPNR